MFIGKLNAKKEEEKRITTRNYPRRNSDLNVLGVRWKNQQNVKLNVVCELKVKIQSKYKANEEEEINETQSVSFFG